MLQSTNLCTEYSYCNRNWMEVWKWRWGWKCVVMATEAAQCDSNERGQDQATG